MNSKQDLIDRSLRTCGILLGCIVISALEASGAIANPVNPETGCSVEILETTPEATTHGCASEQVRSVLSTAELDDRFQLLIAIVNETSNLSSESQKAQVWQEIATQIHQFADAHGLGTVDGQHPLAVTLNALEDRAISLTSPRSQADVWVAIAKARTTMGHGEQALEHLAIATEQSTKVSEPEQQIRILNAIANVYIALDRPSPARETLVEATVLTAYITDDWWTHQSLRQIAASYIALGDQTDAADMLHRILEVLQTMNPSPVKFLGRQDVIDLAQQLGDESLTIGILESLLATQDNFAPESLTAIAAATGDLSNSQAASALLLSVIEKGIMTDDPFVQLAWIDAIATAAGQWSNLENAAPVLTRAAEATEDITDVWIKADAKVAIASAYDVLGDAKQATHHIEAALQTIERPHRELNASVIESAEVSGDFSNADFFRGAYIRHQVDTLTALIAAVGKFSETTPVDNLLEQAMDTALSTLAEHNLNVEQILWPDIAVIYAARGDDQRANYFLDQSLTLARQTAHQTTDSETELSALSIQLVALAYMEIGQPLKAVDILNEAIAHTTTLTNEQDRFAALYILVETHKELGDLALAQPGLDLILAQPSFSEVYPSYAVTLLRQVAQAYGHLGDRQGTDRAIRQSLAVPQVSFDKAQAIYNVLAAARIYHQFGHDDDAIRLLDVTHRMAQDEFFALPLSELEPPQRLEVLSILQVLAWEYDGVGYRQRVMDVVTEAIAIINAVEESDAMEATAIPSSERMAAPELPSSNGKDLSTLIGTIGRLTDDQTRIEALTMVLPNIATLAEGQDRTNNLTLMVRPTMMSEAEAEYRLAIEN